MDFTFETVYNQKAMAAMARALRKTIRKKKSRRSHLFGWIVVVLGLLLILPLGGREFTFGLKSAVTLLAVLAIFVVLLWEDQINGYFARKRMLPGTGTASAVFHDEGYHTVTEIGETDWHYDKVAQIAETDDYFVFLFNISHAQLYDKSSIAGGTADEFRRFIEEKTGKAVERIR